MILYLGETIAITLLDWHVCRKNFVGCVLKAISTWKKALPVSMIHVTSSIFIYNWLLSLNLSTFIHLFFLKNSHHHDTLHKSTMYYLFCEKCEHTFQQTLLNCTFLWFYLLILFSVQVRPIWKSFIHHVANIIQIKINKPVNK